MSFWVYILKCADDSYYTGHTDNLDVRIGAHQAGEVPGYTLSRRPLELVFAQEFPTRYEALLMERQIKGWSRAKKEAMMRSDWARVSELARSKAVRPSTSSGRTD
jgi:predicted GIY-YIG superfamily endonuclease